MQFIYARSVMKPTGCAGNCESEFSLQYQPLGSIRDFCTYKITVGQRSEVHTENDLFPFWL